MGPLDSERGVRVNGKEGGLGLLEAKAADKAVKADRISRVSCRYLWNV